MRIKSMVVVLSIFLLTWMSTDVVFAEQDLETFKIDTKQAFEAQVKLSEQDRTLEEMRMVLEPYFTEAMIERFLEENAVRIENGKYRAFGSDFALHYVPFFSYDQETEVVVDNGDVVVGERFGSEGPVDYGNKYLGVRFIEADGDWKISEVEYELPESLFNTTASNQEQSYQAASITSQPLVEQTGFSKVSFVKQWMVMSLFRPFIM